VNVLVIVKPSATFARGLIYDFDENSNTITFLLKILP